MSVNKVILIGRLGSDVELKQTPAGNMVANFNIATGEKYKGKDGQMHEKTEWHRIVVWQKLAEICSQYLTKGRQVYIEGQLQTRKWEKDNQTHYTTEVLGKTVQFLGEGNKDKQQQSQQSESYQKQAEPAPGFSAEDIPF